MARCDGRAGASSARHDAGLDAALVFASAPAAQDSLPIPAHRLVDSIGVNVHLHHTDTPYGNFAMVRTRLAELGVRHVRAYPARMAQVFGAFEAPNEFDLTGGPNWPSVLRQSLGQLRALRAVPGLEGYPLYGPSLTSEAAFAAIGDVATLVDAANIHNYFAGRHPGTSGWGPNGLATIHAV